MKQKWANQLAAAGIMLLLAGCMTTSQRRNSAQNDIFDYDGMPLARYIVGGGYFISYRAEVYGDLYVADHASKRLLATISMEPGQKHEINYDVHDEQMLATLKSLGIDPEKSLIKLYFVPR